MYYCSHRLKYETSILKQPRTHKLRLLGLFFSLLLHGNKIYSQQLSKKQETLIRHTISQYLGAEANLRVLNNGKAAFIRVGKDTLFNIHGLRYVYKLTRDTAIRLDKSVYHGSNFYRYLFEHDNKLMALGGYGMFVTNHNLEAFSPESHEWYLIETHGDIPVGIKGSGIRIGDTLYIFNNCIEGNNINITVPDQYYYALDLKTMTWMKHREYRPSFLSTTAFDFFYLNDFVIAKGINHSFVYNLKTREYIFHDNDALGIRSFNGYNTEVDKNNLIITIKDTFQFVYKDTLRNINDLWNENKKLAVPLVFSTPIWYSIEPYFTPISLLLLLVAVLIWALFQWVSKRNHHSATNPIIQKIIDHPENVISLETLDRLLEIDFMEAESRKTKRHRLMMTIESLRPGLIVRKKDETDKRRFVYHIDK